MTLCQQISERILNCNSYSTPRMVVSSSFPTEHTQHRLDPVQLSHQLSQDARQFTLEIVNETGSTNTDLITRWRTQQKEFSHPLVRLTYSQTQGRGRLGRTWLGSNGGALLFSVAYLIPRPIHALAGLSLATGVTLLAGLHTLPLAEPQRLALKWPNDVLLDGAKLAGILIETAWHTPTASAAVIGIGLNLCGEDALSLRLDELSSSSSHTNQPAALTRLLPAVSITDAFAALLNALAPMLKNFSAEGFALFQKAWSAHHAFTGQPVTLLQKDGLMSTHGIALGVDSLGRLLLENENGIQSIASGDLSLRLNPTISSAPKPYSKVSE